MSNFLLTIAIPTVDRRNFLEKTLNEFLPQIIRNSSEVELVISNNASDDDTHEYLDELIKEFDFIKYYKSKIRLSLFDSFSKAAELASGRFLVLWGDDDIPAPFFIETIIEIIKQKPDIGLIHYNRLIGYNSGENMNGLKIFKSSYSETETLYQNLKDFTKYHLYESTFMSTVVFMKSDWDEGLKYNTFDHYGFEFLGTIYAGMCNKMCIYINYPLCIQRKPFTRTWSSDWPLYGLIGIPNMVKDFERKGFYENGYKIWYKTYNTLISYIYTLICAASYKNKYKVLCKEINKHQKSYLRKLLCYTIIYFCPSQTYGIIRKIQFKIK
jgi:hypothetical protein